MNPERQSFKCWVCDIGGDVFSFVMRVEGVEFREALEMLAERAGISLTPRGGPATGGGEMDRANLLRVMAWAESQFHQCLLHTPEAQPARNYLADRGISDDSTRRFHLGFSPDSWDWLLRRAGEAGYSPPVLERAGLVIKNEDRGTFYDRFRGRLLFSIRDVRSRPIAFGGRILPEAQNASSGQGSAGAKYINSPETPLFSKSNQLYALDLARDGIAREGGLLVMEGYTDVVMAHQHGIDNAVAVLGTALGEKHVPLVRRFTDRITLILDGDEAGQRRTMQILDQLLALFVEQEIDLQFLGLPKGSDPCDVIASQGCEAFRQLLQKSVDAIEYKIRAVTNGLALPTDTHRASQAVEEILGTLARVRLRSGSASSPALLREQQVLTRLSRESGIGEEQLRMRLTGLRREQSARQRTASHVPSEDQPHNPGLRPRLAVWEQELMELLLAEPQVIEQLAAGVTLNDMQTDAGRALFGLAMEIHQGGNLPTFDAMMLALDAPEMKSLLVDCDEQSQAKVTSDSQMRLSDLFAQLEQRKSKAERQAESALLKQQKLDPPARGGNTKKEVSRTSQPILAINDCNVNIILPVGYRAHGWVWWLVFPAILFQSHRKCRRSFDDPICYPITQSSYPGQDPRAISVTTKSTSSCPTRPTTRRKRACCSICSTASTFT